MKAIKQTIKSAPHDTDNYIVTVDHGMFVQVETVHHDQLIDYLAGWTDLGYEYLPNNKTKED